MTPQPLRQSHIDWLLSHGVTIDAMIYPEAMLASGGTFYFPDDDAFWEPKNNNKLTGHFCLGADEILETSHYSFDGALPVFETPLQWLKANRRGIVVIDWSRAFDNLRDCPRVSVPRSLMPLWKKHMRPPRLPTVRIAA